MAHRTEQRQWTTWNALLVAAAVFLGWALHDLAFMGVTAEPGLVFKLLPGSLAAVALGGLLGGLALRVRWLLGIAILLVGFWGWGLRRFVHVEASETFFYLPKALFLLLLGMAVAGLLVRRWGFSASGTGLAIGAVLAALFVAYMMHRESLNYSQTALTLEIIWILAAVIGLSFMWLRSRALRLVVGALCLSIPLLFGLYSAMTQGGLPRPDQALAAEDFEQGAPNLVFITLDAVRAESLAPYGYERVTTPGLDAFVSKHATLYWQARSTSSWTLPAHGSLFTGLFPAEHAARHPREGEGEQAESRFERAGHALRWAPALPLRSDVPTLAAQLAERGYRTGAIVANGAYLAHEFGVDRGFEYYDDRMGARSLPRYALVQLVGLFPGVGRREYRQAETITDEALRWLADAEADERPFFLFLNYMDAHFPYIPARPFDGAFEERRPVDPRLPPKELWSLLYDRELLYLDHHLTRLLSWLEAREWFDAAVVVVTSDHGQAFGEHGLWKHDHSMYEEVVRVPLYIKPAGERQVVRRDEPINGACVYGLTLRELGLEWDGKACNLMIGEWYQSPLATGQHADSGIALDRDLVTWLDESHRKTIVSSRGEIEVYDLTRDPFERANLLPGVPAEDVQQSVETAESWWTVHPPLTGLEPEQLSEEALERLRSLGYVQ